MKKSLLVLLILITLISFAQSPQSFKYQAVVRDAANTLAVNKIISIKSSILLGSPTGSSVYTETQTLSTNDYGVVSLNIGAGTVVSGNFSTISWGSSTYFVKTELDINGGSTYVFMGTSQMLSVPYALYAEKTGSSVSDFDTSPTNEIQTLSVTANSLSISNGNTIILPPDADSNPSNEIQSLQIVGDSLKISNGNAVKISGSIDLDASPVNEIQNLSYNQDTIKLSLANNIVLPHDADRDSLNELQTLSISNKTITLSKGNSINLMDNDSLNEIQSLSLSQGTLKLTKANSVHLPDSSATNEIQTLSISGKTITLNNNGGQIVLPIPNYNFNPEFQNYGNGGDGVFVSSGTSVLDNDIKSYKNFWLKSTDSLKIKGTVMIKVQDTCKIEGIIYGKGLGGFTNLSTLGGTGGGGGYSDGNNCVSSINGQTAPSSAIPYYFINYTNNGGLLSGSAQTDFGGNGNKWDSTIIYRLLSLNQIPLLQGKEGGVGANNAGAVFYGGSGLYINCRVLKFTGIINLQGANSDPGALSGSSSATYIKAASGAGGGGTCIISANNIIQNTGTHLSQGGNGGAAVPLMTWPLCSLGGTFYSTKGGNGGDGWFILIQQ